MTLFRAIAVFAGLFYCIAPSNWAQANPAQVHLAQGIRLATQKHYKAAQLEFEKADALKPGDFAIQFNLGQVILLQGDDPRAELILTQALKLQPQSAETMLLLAEAESDQGRALDALDLLTHAHTLTPSNPDILYHMALLSMAQGYFADAVPLLHQALQLAPARTDIQIALGKGEFNAEKTDEAIATLQSLPPSSQTSVVFAYLGLAYSRLGRFDEALRDFHQCLHLDPPNNFCLFQTGHIAHLQGDSKLAETIYARILHDDTNYPSALLDLATLRMEQKRFAEAVVLLQRYVKNSNEAAGYYKLAMAENALHDSADAQRDLASFQRLSRDAAPTSHPYDHLFDYVSDRSKLSASERMQQDLSSLIQQAKLHPDQPSILYALTEAYLRNRDIPNARATASQLDSQRPDDTRTITGLGVLFARYSLYDDAIIQLQKAIAIEPNDDTLFDLADSELHKGNYADALAATQRMSPTSQHEETCLSLLADIDTHIGDLNQAASLYESAIQRNPDNDQDYLSLALLQMRQGSLSEARQTLTRGQSRVPASGKIVWGLGVLDVLVGNTAAAATELERAVELLPQWPGTYATLGFLYYQTGQIDKAREMLDRFQNSGARGGFDIARIQQALAQSSSTPTVARTSLEPAQRIQVFQLALYLVDKTL